MNIVLTVGVCALAISAAPVTFPSPFNASFATVPRIDCIGSRGSGVRLSDTLIVTAAHVNIGRTCAAMNAPMTSIAQEAGLDLSYATAPMPPGLRAIISCDGVVEGQRYLALGYPDGESPSVQILIGTRERGTMNQAAMTGRVYHGMSGGGVFDADGRVVAIINAINPTYSISFVTPLSATVLCRK